MAKESKDLPTHTRLVLVPDKAVAQTFFIFPLLQSTFSPHLTRPIVLFAISALISPPTHNNVIVHENFQYFRKRSLHKAIC